MNTRLVLFHLKEAQEELNHLVDVFEHDPDEGQSEFEVRMQHLYHHLNSGWHSQDAPENERETDKLFFKRRQFPSDIDMS